MNPKFKIGQEVRWQVYTLIIQGVRDYQGHSWVYDFFPTTNTIVPLHFTGIPEREIYVIRSKRWWEFWK